MDIQMLLKKDIMILDLKAQNQISAIKEMVAQLKDKGYVTNEDQVTTGVLEREGLGSTGLGNGLAIPHVKCRAIKEPVVLFAKSKSGVDYNAMDGEPVYIFLMIAVPENKEAGNLHLEVLAEVSKLFIDNEFINRLREAQSANDVSSIFTSALLILRKEEQIVSDTGTSQLIVAVTACPTGIAHTFMAEKSLIETGKRMGVRVRVETNGSEGVGNRLTQEEIMNSIGVIIAADKKIEMGRFAGKSLVETSVSAGIKTPEVLIRKILAGNASVYQDDSGENMEDDSKNGRPNNIYKHLMNGVSHMLPFVVGGGILLAVSFLLENTVGTDHPVYSFFGMAGSNAFSFLIPILAAYIAMSIGDQPALMPGMVGGLMAANGGAGFLGGLAAGFISGYGMNQIKRLSKKMPESLNGTKPTLVYPVVGLILVAASMQWVVTPIFSALNEIINNALLNMGTTNSILLGAVLGGMMAIDLGGPFNKAAYTFALGVYTTTNDSSLMSVVMLGGMVPPLAIAISTTFFKRKYTKEDQQSGITNYVLGLSFVSEGAIPFAAVDPLRVLSSSILGSAIAGGLSQMWKVTMPAPHGGIFVSVLSNKPVHFCLALVIGSVISGIVLGVWKKEV